MTDPNSLPDLTDPPKTGPTNQAHGTSDPDRERLDALADQVASEEGQGGGQSGATAAPSTLDTIPFDAFLEAFKAAHFMAGQLIRSKALTDAPNSPACEPAAKAIYETCQEVEYFRFLIQPEGKWMQRALAVGAFALPTAMGVAGELRQRREGARAKAAKDVSPPKQKPANDNDRRAYDG